MRLLGTRQVYWIIYLSFSSSQFSFGRVKVCLCLYVPVSVTAATRTNNNAQDGKYLAGNSGFQLHFVVTSNTI